MGWRRGTLYNMGMLVIPCHELMLDKLQLNTFGSQSLFRGWEGLVQIGGGSIIFKQGAHKFMHA